jgi:rhodanese-related sulfurtransferase
MSVAQGLPESEVNMPPTCGALVALIFVAIIGYYFWRGTVVVMNARHLVDDQGALLLDVGTPTQFTAAHIAGSVNIPAPVVALRQTEIGSRERPIVVYARSGLQSARATHVLRSIGYQSVTNIGPMRRWGEPMSKRWEGDPLPEVVVGRSRGSSTSALPTS